MQDDRTPASLDTGERIDVRPWWDGGYEAVVLVPSLPGPADHHALGNTPEEAVLRLQHYVTMRRREVNYDD